MILHQFKVRKNKDGFILASCICGWSDRRIFTYVDSAKKLWEREHVMSHDCLINVGKQITASCECGWKNGPYTDTMIANEDCRAHREKWTVMGYDPPPPPHSQTQAEYLAEKKVKEQADKKAREETARKVEQIKKRFTKDRI